MKIDDFTGLYWNGKHTSDLKLKVVSASDRYNLNPISTITNNTVDIPGGDGQYFYNSTYGPKKWTVNIAFDSLDDNDWRELHNWLYHKDISDLVFDELPYKAYGAKIEGTPSITYLCFDEPDKSKPLVNGKYQTKRIYKGEGTLNFLAPYPYAYSARNYDGTYMKYLSDLEYYKNKTAEYKKSINIGSANSIAVPTKSTIQLSSIRGKTSINRDTNEINRGLIYDGETIYPLTISCASKVWTGFNLNQAMEDIENKEVIFFDSLQENTDEIKFISKDNSDEGYYSFYKRVGSIQLNKIKGTIQNINLINQLTNETQTISQVTLNLEDIISTEKYQNIDFSAIDTQTKVYENFILDNNYFTFISKPAYLNVPSFWVDDITINNKTQEITNIKISFGVPEEQTYILNNFLNGKLENNWFFFPQKEVETRLLEKTNSSSILEQKIEDECVFSINNKSQYSDTNLFYEVEFNIIPSLYNNIDEWYPSSGLKPSHIDISDSLEYDICQKLNDSSTYGYKVYNGGDLSTPFRITLPIKNKKVSFNDNEIVFALVHYNKEQDYNAFKQIESLNDLAKGIIYYYNDNEIYFQKITNYARGVAQFIDKDGNSLELPFKDIKRKVENTDYTDTINFFSIRLNDTDSLESYAQIVQDYTTAALNKDNNIENFLEIDTYKQTINFIIKSTLTNKEEIIPIYFTLCRGELFNIPPKLDNLYLLVYNLRESEDPFIIDKVEDIPKIEYRYLYL
jgi:predicted phage tail component-like protein